MNAVAVIVGGVDAEVWGASYVVCKVSKDGCGRVAGPVAIPDVIDVNSAENERAAVIGYAVAMASMPVSVAASFVMATVVMDSIRRQIIIVIILGVHGAGDAGRP